MIFHSVEFIFLFLPITLLGFFLLGKYLEDNSWCFGWLALCSIFFYGWGDQAFMALIVGSAIFNYLIAKSIFSYDLFDQARVQRSILTFGIVVNLGLLGFFKYADFFIDSVAFVTGFDTVSLSIVLPLAISFFTLQQIAYLVDVSRGVTTETSFLRYLLFVTFFPQLIAGPIVHHSEMLPQFKEHHGRINLDDVCDGLGIFFLGLFKKLILADGMAGIADPVFAAADTGDAPSFLIAWIAVMAFSLQIYFDFSAYTDMAIGLARMFSIRLPQNFDSPYKATSIIDFWRRWHMTLSRFLRDYLYIPLGGSRRGPIYRYRNLFLTMLIGGLWHGAAWGFVVWGGLHGLYLTINHLWRINPICQSVSEQAWFRPLGWFLTFIAVSVAWIFFRAESFDGAMLMFNGILGLNNIELPAQVFEEFPFLSTLATPATTPILLLSFLRDGVFIVLAGLLVLLAPTIHEISERRRLILIVLTIGFSTQALFYGTTSEFIYFRF